MSDREIEVLSPSVAQTIAIGGALGRSLAGGEVIGLIGELGTGKTHLIKGIAEGLCIEDSKAVTSPTFTLINEYEGRLRDQRAISLIHVDAYRLDNAGQLASLGFDEMVCDQSVVVVEWADRVDSLLLPYVPILVLLKHQSESERVIHVKNVSAELCQELAREN